MHPCRYTVRLAALGIFLAFATTLGHAAPKPPTPGAWSMLTTDAPTAAGMMLQMTDGSIMMQGWDPGDNWIKLTPDAYGSYVNGTWTTLTPMSIPRLYFASHVLQDGRLWLLGGEYTGTPFVAHFSNTAEIYDPLTNSWSPAAPHPETRFGDDPSMLLPGGRILAGSIRSRNSFVYDIATNTWGPAIPKVYNDRSDEEGWVKLADGGVLTYDLFQSKATGGSYAEKFDPTANTWISISPSDGTANGVIPQLSANSVGSELGPMLRLLDGRVFIVGATGHTALYDESTNTWSAGPDVIGTLNGNPALFGADDAPGCVMPNGHVLFAADAGPSVKTFAGPTQLFDFDPDTNTISRVPSPTTDFDDPQFPAFVLRFLVLPTGQVAMTTSNDQHVYIYTVPDTTANRIRPRIEGIKYNGGGIFTLSGQQLNGQSAGSAYGDDSEMDQNYPLVSLTAKDGRVFYARTTNWSTTGVASGTAKETVDFTLPASLTTPDVYKVTVTGAGTQSVNTPAINISAAQIAGS
jgi:hypothetical protein